MLSTIFDFKKYAMQFHVKQEIYYTLVTKIFLQTHLIKEYTWSL